MTEIEGIFDIRILMAEDNPRHLERAKQWMGRYGYIQVDTARTVAETREKLQQNPYDIIVVDMRMEKDDSGYEIIKIADELRLNSAVIIFTANDTVEDCRKSFNSGVWDYISKNMRGNPFEELHKSIQSWLQKGKPEPLIRRVT
jgi:DNA-binding NtrC family response regulator